MTAAILENAPAEAEVQHQSWCTEHCDGDNDVCWAQDIELRIKPDTGDDRGRITVMMTHNAQPNPRRANRSRNITIFVDSFPDGDDSTDFDPDEAEVAAHALLAMVALSRGEDVDAVLHRRHAETIAAGLLARREAGAR